MGYSGKAMSNMSCNGSMMHQTINSLSFQPQLFSAATGTCSSGRKHCSPEALTEGALRSQRGEKNGIISVTAGGRLRWANRAWPCLVLNGEIGSRAVVGLLHSSPMFAFSLLRHQAGNLLA